MPEYEIPVCAVCGSPDRDTLFTKKSSAGESFTLARCRSCGLKYISPRPDNSRMSEYYRAQYFTRRTDRGYDNYFSPELRREIERVMLLNLRDLGFFEYEKSLSSPGRALDIGCAAGYFVALMRDRGWKASGIDVSPECVDFAVKSLEVDAVLADYLDTEYNDAFDLITLWATIEHLHYPGRVIAKAFRDLRPGGYLYLTTCREGGLNFMRLYGEQWRFYNFPEHLYYFSKQTMKILLERNGFSVDRYHTYGSGFGESGSVLRKTADRLAKNLKLGDMMLVSTRKK